MRAGFSGSCSGASARASMSKTNLCLAILALSVAIGFAATAHAEKRVALLVGNNTYQNVPRLQTAVNDARAVGTALRGLGFSVIPPGDQAGPGREEGPPGLEHG